jgi:hypothetical protein
MATIDVLDATSNVVSIEKPLTPGRAAAATSRPVALSTEDLAALSLSSLTAVMSKYETVAASQTDQVIGPTGATGDYLAGVLIVPATTSPGAVSIKDGAGSAITIFTGGATSVSNLVPFYVPLGIKTVSGAVKITTGSSVSAIAVGAFT